MVYSEKIVIQSKSGCIPTINDLIDDLIQAQVKFVAVIGKDAVLIEDVIDEICVGDGTNSYFMITTSHPNETLEEALEFARIQNFNGDVQLIEF